MEFTKENTAAVGKITSGLYIITAQKEGQQDGYLASFVQQVSFKPLLVSIAINPGRPAYDLISAGGVFTINVVGGKNNGLMKPFWSGYDPEKNPFEALETAEGENGGLLLKDAMAAIECRKVESIKPGDHEIIIAEVVGSTMINEEDKPLPHVRKSGLDY